MRRSDIFSWNQCNFVCFVLYSCIFLSAPSISSSLTGWDASRGFPADLPFAAHDALALYDALFFVLKAKCAKLPQQQPAPSAELVKSLAKEQERLLKLRPENVLRAMM